MPSAVARAMRLPAAFFLLLVLAAPAAHAVDERAWVTAGAGAVLYDPEQGLRDGVGLSVRAAGFLNRWVGVEGLFSTSSPTLESPAVGDATFTHFGGGLILTPDRNRWTLPYLYAGLGSAKVDAGATASASHSAFHLGGGILLRAGERFGFRLDGRNISYKQEGGPGRDTRVNTFFLSGGVTALWMGRPRDSDTDGVPDKRDTSPETPAGAIVDASGIPLDTDKDGVYDGLDKGPSTPLGARVDAQGVALDADSDGVPDGIDQCDSTAAGVVVDTKGCGVDTDGDKVSDGPDKCPDTPAGAVVNAEGCPVDEDGDGVADGVDSCPYTPAGTVVNAGGCPLGLSRYERDLTDDWMIRLSDLEFPPDSAELLPRAMARIDSVGAALVQWPSARIEIGAHVDDTPEPGYRIPLSQMRVRAVATYLFQRYPALNQKNFSTAAYGDLDPVVPNTSSSNRAVNRRVDFRVMNMHVLHQEKQRREALGSTPAPPAPGLVPRAPGPAEGQGAPPKEPQVPPKPTQ